MVQLSFNLFGGGGGRKVECPRWSGSFGPTGLPSVLFAPLGQKTMKVSLSRGEKSAYLFTLFSFLSRGAAAFAVCCLTLLTEAEGLPQTTSSLLPSPPPPYKLDHLDPALLQPSSEHCSNRKATTVEKGRIFSSWCQNN